jgi:hypothetical protein
MKDCVEAHGCAIAIDKNGIFGKAKNSTAMVWASIKDNKLESSITEMELLGTNQQRPPQNNLDGEVERQANQLGEFQLSD